MQVHTNNGRVIMKDGKVGIGSDCCSLTCDGYGGGGGGGGCNDDIMGVCCVPGTGGTAGEATQCDCDAAGGTWRFPEVAGEEVSPGVFDRRQPAGMDQFTFAGDGAGIIYNVCDCDAGANLTIVWRDLQPHPDYDPTQGDTPPLVACNKCKSFVSISDAEEFFADQQNFPDQAYTQSQPGLVFCDEQDCYTPTQDPADPAWIWSDPLIMPGDSDIYSRNCTKIPNHKIPGCLDLDNDGVSDGGTGGTGVNPCYDPNSYFYIYCNCTFSFYAGFQSGVWSNSNTWEPCVEYGYDGASDCCGGPDCPPCP